MLPPIYHHYDWPQKNRNLFHDDYYYYINGKPIPGPGYLYHGLHRHSYPGNLAGLRHHHHPSHLHYLTKDDSPRPPRLRMELLSPNTGTYYGDPRFPIYEYDDIDYNPLCPHCQQFPQISSRHIPSMHYEQLRCPHCAAHVHPAPEDVLAYPWTVQTNRPQREGLGGTDKRTLDAKRINLGISIAPPSAVSAPPFDNSNNKKSVDNVPPFSAPPKPFIRPAYDLLSKNQKKWALQRPANRVTLVASPGISEVVYDDGLSPMDSVSNVEAPPLRAESTVLMDASRSGVKPVNDTVPLSKSVVGTDVYDAYPKEKFFRSLQYTPPRRAPATPGPRKASQPKRTLQGEYIDIRNGQKYAYKVNYHRGNKLTGHRRLTR